jgi:DNA-binding LacI/PurR family transcriptional regulator
MGISVNILQIAQAAGVSPATVSRVFNQPDKVRARTRSTVLSIAKGRGYQPNSAAIALRTQRSKILGVMLPTFGNPVFAECLEGIADEAAKNGFGVMPMTSDYSNERETHIISRLMARGVDGMVLVVRNPNESKGLRLLKRQLVPFVLAYNQHPQHQCVGVDGQGEVAAAVERLYGIGHRRIAMVSGKLRASDRAQQRYQGYLLGMQSMRLTPTPLIQVDFIASDMQTLVTQLKQSPSKRPTALICSNDLLALRSIRAAHQCGLSVPTTLSVVGFDGIAIGRELSPMLTTVIQPNHDIGLQATALLLESLGKQPNDQKPVTLTLKCGYRLGETVCSPPTTRSHLG